MAVALRPRATLGLIGGGQLGRLLIQAAIPMGVAVHVLDPDPQCPAAPAASRLITAPFDDAAGLHALSRGCDAVTLEIEAPPAALLAALEAEGVPVRPGAAVMERLQDKLFQRKTFEAFGLPQPRFVEARGPLRSAVSGFGAPCVLKARRAGYDGRGVHVVSGHDDPVLKTWSAPALLEQKVDIAIELAVVVVRGLNGDCVSYDPVELLMDPEEHVLDLLAAPARIAPALAAQAVQLALRTVQGLEGVGAFGVELFVDRSGGLLVNEVSPRVHNSGHHSLEACASSQFANHLRAVLGWPLGSADTLRPAAVANLLGPPGLRGPYRTEGMAALAGEAYLHLYGKAEARPGRKLGHITTLADSVDEALALARVSRKQIQFLGGA
jgi:5-(carboxyamino)imidazole ribonucleotide synthase